MIRRSLPTALMAAVLVAAGSIALGRPNWAVVGGFLGGAYPTEEATLAVTSVLCWVIIIAVCLVALGNSLRESTDIQWLQRRWTRAILFVAAGIVVLGAGTFRHTVVGYSICCGQSPARIQEATELAK